MRVRTSSCQLLAAAEATAPSPGPSRRPARRPRSRGAAGGHDRRGAVGWRERSVGGARARLAVHCVWGCALHVQPCSCSAGFFALLGWCLDCASGCTAHARCDTKVQGLPGTRWMRSANGARSGGTSSPGARLPAACALAGQHGAPDGRRPVLAAASSPCYTPWQHAAPEAASSSGGARPAARAASAAPAANPTTRSPTPTSLRLGGAGGGGGYICSAVERGAAFFQRWVPLAASSPLRAQLIGPARAGKEVCGQQMRRERAANPPPPCAGGLGG